MRGGAGWGHTEMYLAYEPKVLNSQVGKLLNIFEQGTDVLGLVVLGGSSATCGQD